MKDKSPPTAQELQALKKIYVGSKSYAAFSMQDAGSGSR